MWKKDDESSPTTNTSAGMISAPRSKSAAPAVSASGEAATIGRSITIRGDVSGDEDLYIQGRIEGTVDLKQHNVTVGPEGRVKANIKGRMVTIEGEVDGDVLAQEQVALRSASKVNGDIVAPRVVLEDGASFLGSIDMSGKAPSDHKQEPKPTLTERPKADPIPPPKSHTNKTSTAKV
jgi:cytoskeletal protein CcmA (bactofilin family)